MFCQTKLRSWQDINTKNPNINLVCCCVAGDQKTELCVPEFLFTEWVTSHRRISLWSQYWWYSNVTLPFNVNIKQWLSVCRPCQNTAWKAARRCGSVVRVKSAATATTSRTSACSWYAWPVSSWEVELERDLHKIVLFGFMTEISSPPLRWLFKHIVQLLWPVLIFALLV